MFRKRKSILNITIAYLFSWRLTMVGSIRVLILLFVLLTISLILLREAKAGKFGLEVQDVEINPAVAEIGERVGIKFNIVNTEKNNINCGVTAFCGDSTLDTRETKVGGLSSIPLYFELDTGCMSAGVYSIEAIVETDSGQQQIFSLGDLSVDEKLTMNEVIPIEEFESTIDEGFSLDEKPIIDEVIPIEKAEPTIDEGTSIDEVEPTIDESAEAESTKNTFVATTSTSFNWEYLLPVVPAGVVSSVMIVQYKRKKSRDDAMPKEQMSSMFNEILKFEQQMENGASTEDNTNYIA